MYLSAQTSPAWTAGNAKKWIKSNVWANGWTVSPHKSVNAIEFASQYQKNKDVWDAAFRFLADHDLEELAVGNHVIIEGKCWATVSEYIPKEVEKGNIESHRRFVDLQYTFRGNEKMGLARDVEVRQEYNPQKDVAFYTSSRIRYYSADVDSFFLFFPSDIHQPSVRGKGEPVESRKIVIKIEYID
ncbi:YhcH/YjgK/YiaL family protein [Bacteroides sp. GD17]|uniref:YhcH/YjgK/YiaL family protein n=1 Tax=Bacteroides sp. GD17 TaxID=3139826 RepID=UPI0025E60ADE|nr:YhcH/YjgK/YiaL family protein [uncultured Bacteroides sp.]